MNPLPGGTKKFLGNVFNFRLPDKRLFSDCLEKLRLPEARGEGTPCRWVGRKEGLGWGREAQLCWNETRRAHLPDMILADGMDEVLDAWLREMLIIISNQFAVNGWHCHKDVDPGSLETQEGFPDLEERGTGSEKIPAHVQGHSGVLGSERRLKACGSAPGRTERRKKAHRVIGEPNHKPALSHMLSKCSLPKAM